MTGLPFFGERGIDRLHNESNPDVSIQMRFVDERGAAHELTRTRRKNRMTITYDGYEIRQLDLTDLFGERDVFLSILNPLYFIEELGEDGKNLLERYLPLIPQEMILAQLAEPVRASLKDEFLLSPDAYLKRRREEIRGLEERITYLGGQRDLAAAQEEQQQKTRLELADQLDGLKAEIAALEEKQFAGLDVERMQERLVELSRRYDETAQRVDITINIDYHETGEHFHEAFSEYSYALDTVCALLEKYGFAVAKVADGESFGPVRGDSPRWIITAVKQYTQEEKANGTES